MPKIIKIHKRFTLIKCRFVACKKLYRGYEIIPNYNGIE